MNKKTRISIRVQEIIWMKEYFFLVYMARVEGGGPNGEILTFGEGCLGMS